MTIEVGQTLPAGKLSESIGFDPENGCPLKPEAKDVGEMVKGKTVVIFGVPVPSPPYVLPSTYPVLLNMLMKLKRPVLMKSGVWR